MALARNEEGRPTWLCTECDTCGKTPHRAGPPILVELIAWLET